MTFQSNGKHNEGEEQTLREMVRGLHTKLDKVLPEVQRLNNVVMGDKDAEVDGLVHTVKKHGTYISVDKKLKWLGAGAMFTGGAGIWEVVKQWLKL